MVFLPLVILERESDVKASACPTEAKLQREESDRRHSDLLIRREPRISFQSDLLMDSTQFITCNC